MQLVINLDRRHHIWAALSRARTTMPRDVPNKNQRLSLQSDTQPSSAPLRLDTRMLHWRAQGKLTGHNSKRPVPRTAHLTLAGPGYGYLSDQ